MTAAAVRAEAPRRDAIVAGVDHSAESRGALRVAVELAERLDSRLVLVTVKPPPDDLPPGMAAQADELVLIAVGTRPRRVEGAVLGSVSRMLCASSPWPVVVVNEGTSEGRARPEPAGG